LFCGLGVAARVFERVDAALQVAPLAHDGDRIRKGTRVLSITGPTASMLTAERTALNFVQRLSGIATLSRKFADAVADTGVRIVDTRKTTPGWRALEKYAVRCGGCFNHRSSLGEHVLIKDNHIAAAGSLSRAVKLARDAAPHLAKIEVEAKTLAEVKEALRAKAEVILLDNMPPETIRRAVELIAGAAVVEVSGGVRFETVRDYALPGVNVISIGALTHSATAVDLSLDLIGGSAGAPANRNRKRGRDARDSRP
jgi:nicotinate-nucleotide pyrophosphorylase (carboxylating)